MLKFILIEPVNFSDYPPGGQLNFAKQIITSFGSQVALVGISTEDEPIGKWFNKEIEGKVYKFFSIGRRRKSGDKPIVPDRIANYFGLRRYKNEILSLNVKNVFIQGQEVIMTTSGWGWASICYRFPGLENPLSISRYKHAELLANLFDKFFFPAVARADVVLATADEKAIDEMLLQRGCLLDRSKIHKFPTRVDTKTFFPVERNIARATLELPSDGYIFATCGRLHWAKGWELLIDAFIKFLTNGKKAYLLFIGDGEERDKIVVKCQKSGIQDKVLITGRQSPENVAQYLNASDLFLLGSYKEGWSTVLVEALACRKTIVSTNVSSASDLVEDGGNGYIVSDRNPETFSLAMEKALLLDQRGRKGLSKASQYSIETLSKDLKDLWTVL